MSGWPETDAFAAAWRAALAGDAVLAALAGPWSIGFTIGQDGHRFAFSFQDGRAGGAEPPAFAITAPAGVWAKFLMEVPPRHHHVVLAMLARVPAVRLEGDGKAFAQHCHLVRRVLEVGRHLARGGRPPVPATARPPAAPPAGERRGHMARVDLRGVAHDIFWEEAGQGQDILCLHTAGADLRQFWRLMADRRLTARHRLVAFDLPWHGRSPPTPGAPMGSWSLNTDLYVEIIMAFVAAAGIERPIVLGASMSGEICLELALRHPEAFRAIIACEATDHVAGRRTPWAFHPEVNQSLFVPEWIHGLMAPQSPAECAAEVLWHYAQGGPGVFRGDIDFYSGEWDARDRVGRIDTNRCPLVMLTGEYDYSCTAEMSAATAAKIPGARFRRMDGIGHFPFAENPALFADYLLEALREVG